MRLLGGWKDLPCKVCNLVATMKTVTSSEVLKREQAKARREALELALAQQLRAHKLAFTQQHRFDPERKWRFDFAILCGAHPLAIEVQGGIYTGGRHTRGAAIEGECEKMAYAVMAGWRVMPVTGKQVKSGQAIDWIRKALGLI